MTDNFLSDIFEKLANDPSWPWRQDKAKGAVVYGNDKDVGGQFTTAESYTHPKFITQSPLSMAKLALMVIEKQTIIWSYRDEMGKVGNYGTMDREQLMLDFSLKELDIKPDQYAKIKERVEKAGAK